VPLVSSNFTGHKAPGPLTALGGQDLPIVTGKALGGSSTINGLIYSPSVPGEYNAWELSRREGWVGKMLSHFLRRVKTAFRMEILLSEARMVFSDFDIVLTALIHVYLLRFMAESNYQKPELRQRR
jgi:choline dehydrogenase-like flavoprotein